MDPASTRFEAQGLGGFMKVADLNEEILGDDRETSAEQMLDMMIADRPNAGNEEIGLDDGPEQKRDYIVALYPFSLPVAFYSTIFGQIANAQSGGNCIIFSTTAHPASAVAAREHGLETFILRDRPTAHSILRGLRLARRLFFQSRLEEERARIQATAASRKRPLAVSDLQFISITAPTPQPLEVGEVAPATDSFPGGFDNVPAESAFDSAIPQLLDRELDKWGLFTTQPEGGRGRGLASTKSLRDGDLICNVPSLKFSSIPTLQAFLADHPLHADRVVHLSPIMESSEPRSLFVVLMGAAGYCNHFSGIRKTPNAEFVCEPGRGAGDELLRLVCKTSRGEGIKAGKEIVVNYGMSSA